MYWLACVPKRTKVALILTFLTTTFVSINLAITPVSGYEASVYSALGPSLWGLLLLLFAFYLFATLALVIDWNVAEFVASVVGIMTINLVVIVIPALRGYFFYGRSDPATILGIVQSLMETGHVASNNVYPATHVIATTLGYVSGYTIPVTLFFVPLIFAVVLPLFFYCLANTLFDSSVHTSAAVLCSTVPLLGYRQSYILFDQQTMSLLYLPFILYVLIRALEGSRKFLILLTIAIGAFGFFHPVPTILLIVVIFSVTALGYVNFVTLKDGYFTPLLSIGALTGILTIEWFFFIGFLGRVVGRLSAFVLGQISKSAVSRNLSAVHQFDLQEFGLLLIRTMGHTIVFGIISAIAVLHVLYQWHTQPRSRRSVGLVLILVWFTVASTAQLVHVGVGVFNLFIYRFVGPVVVVAPILSAIVITRYTAPSDSIIQSPAIFAIVVIFVVSAPIGLMAIHPSPHTHSVNQQITQSEMSSINWIIGTVPKADGSNIKGVVTRPFRFADFQRGVTWRKQDPRFTRRGFRIRSHFGYDSTSDWNTSIPSNSVVMVSGPDRYAISHSSGLWAEYTSSDYYRFKRDPTVLKCYSNGVTSVYRVQ